jgi:hypothetical protein
LGPAFDEVRLECAAVLDLLYAFRLEIIDSANLGLDGAVLGLDDQNLVLELPNLQSDVVLG